MEYSMRFVSKIKIQLFQPSTTKKAILFQLFQTNFSKTPFSQLSQLSQPLQPTCITLSFKMYETIFMIFRLLFFHKKSEINRTFSAAAVLLHYYNTSTVCNFQSMKSPVEMNSFLSKFFCYATWFVISPDQTRLWTTCK